jgi:hypothetical protein
LSDESEVEESMKIRRFKNERYKKEMVLSNLRLRSFEKKICVQSGDFGKKSEIRLVGS